jgi:hypothetical protein
MSNIENSIIKSKIINHKKFMGDILYVRFVDIGFVSLFFAYRYFNKAHEFGARDISLSLFSILLILSFIYSMKRSFQLLRLSNQKELGKQMQKKSVIIIGLHANALIIGLILFFIK